MNFEPFDDDELKALAGLEPEPSASPRLSEEQQKQFEREAPTALQPLIRNGLIGGGVLLGLLALGGLYRGFSGTVSLLTPPPGTEKETEAAGIDQGPSDKAKLALSTQRQQIEALKQATPETQKPELSELKPASPLPLSPSVAVPEPYFSPLPVAALGQNAAETSPPPSSPPPLESPVATTSNAYDNAYDWTPVAQAYESPPVAAVIEPPLLAPKSISPPIKPVAAAPEPPPSLNEAAEQIQMLRQLGSYQQNAPSLPSEVGFDATSGQRQGHAVRVKPQPSPPTPLPSPESAIPMGSRSVAQLLTPVSAVVGQPLAGEGAVLEVKQPLTSPTGQLLLAQGERLKARVNAVDNSGLIQMEIVALVRHGEELAIPAGVIQIRALDGAPLIAQQHKPQKNGGQTMLEQAALEGLAQGAGVLNQTVTTTITGAGTTVQTQGAPHLLGGIAAGVFGSLAQQVEAAAQSREEALAQQPAVWLLPQATEVALYFTEPLNLAPVSAVSEQPLPLTASPAPPPRSQPVSQPTPNPPTAITPHPAAPEIKVWPTSGTNLSFIQTGETIVRVWVDNPSVVTVDFDQPLCPPAAADCVAGRPSVLHLRVLNGVKIPHIPQNDNRTLLTVLTQTPSGQQRLHTFVIQRASGTPAYQTLEIQPAAPKLALPSPSVISHDVSSPIQTTPPASLPPEFAEAHPHHAVAEWY